ncbi:helix-turn-helix transcriptional regulator [Streptomyces pseudogriseolus]|uniref:helix-turn-helix transcriptional regulator n=1 Tax=Streptomyces pseudogriseolus TaxID=36817 RepID=UPI003FA226FA
MNASKLPDLVGRYRECAVLDELLTAPRAGEPRVRVLRGEAGMGKSVLLEYAAARASHMTVTRAQGVEADMELPYASLHQLCAPFLAQVDELPAPQRDALRVAFGTAAGDPPDRFLVGLAVLTLLTRASENRTVLVLVDDAQWLDQVSLQTLGFVARRLLAEAVAMVFAVRDPEGEGVLTHLPETWIGGLDAASAAQLLGAMGYIQGVLFNGLARYDEALAAAQSAIDHDGFNFRGLSLVEHIEAATRCGRHDEARASLARLLDLTRATDSGWAAGAGARSRALLAEDDEADALYRTALEEFGRGGVTVELARTHLLYGEWLRRNRRPAQAREHLRTAFDMFDGMRAAAFAERARRELTATGEHVRTRATTPSGALTPQESQIATLAAEGMTNARIGAELFISPHTVEWHLRKVYAKLGINSRRALPDALAGAPGADGRPRRERRTAADRIHAPSRAAGTPGPR